MVHKQEKDYRDYIDEQFEKRDNKLISWRNWTISIFFTLISALIFSGFMMVKTIGTLETKTDIIWKKYVPGDLFINIIHSYDLQNKYILSLMNGNSKEADERFEEFIKFRDQMYQERKTTRGSIDNSSYYSPTQGRKANYLTKE